MSERVSLTPWSIALLSSNSADSADLFLLLAPCSLLYPGPISHRLGTGQIKGVEAYRNAYRMKLLRPFHDIGEERSLCWGQVECWIPSNQAVISRRADD